ncbi:MAG: hypothetical protein JXB10_11510 [Pirellulales bacterium]|nr:hypothetical protein [Pirellulales bacterium]
MIRTLSSTIGAVLAACLTLGAAASANEPHTKVPVRDPEHIVRKSPCNWKELKQRNIVMQSRDYSCGAAALATILRYFWGDAVSEEQVLEAITLNLTPAEFKDRVKNGLAISDLRLAAVKMGYASSIGTLSFYDLSKSKVPLVVGIETGGHKHFVVYRGTDCRYVYVADPIRGNIRITVQEFISQWQKKTILAVAKPGRDLPKVSPLSIRCREIQRGELNLQMVRSHLSRPISKAAK